MTLTNFSEKTAVITGGASGIGLAIAQDLYAAGANVVLADINEQGLRKAEGQLKRHSPDTQQHIICLPTDVTREDEIQELMELAVTMCKRIDLVVTCAGIGSGGAIDTFAASEMKRMMDINFMGTFHCIQKALPTMRKQGEGHFVCLSSVAGKLGNPFLSGYCATKWAVRGFTSAVRAELEGSGIGITTVYPGWVDTPMVHQESDIMAGAHSDEPLQTAEQVATAILQAVRENKRDLTLAPYTDITRALQLYTVDPDKAERKMGQAMQQMLMARSAQEVPQA
jgi:NAD(P)-dependent dehydrogenase (short-subunit alcohol dehydrogenase family)